MQLEPSKEAGSSGSSIPRGASRKFSGLRQQTVDVKCADAKFMQNCLWYLVVHCPSALAAFNSALELGHAPPAEVEGSAPLSHVLGDWHSGFS